MVDHISSGQNSKIKLIRALNKKKFRNQYNQYAIEGLHHIGAALEANISMEFIIYSPELLVSDYGKGIINQISSSDVPVYLVSAQILATISTKDTPSGIIVVANKSPEYDLKKFSKKFKWGVGLVAPKDPGNLGSIIRTIDAVQANGLMLIDKGVDQYHPTTVRASMGAIFHVPIINVTFAQFAAWIKANNMTVYGTSAKGGVLCREIEIKVPSLLLLGNEQNGLSKREIELCDEILCLPMDGKMSSLNLSVAAGIFLYEMKKTFD